MSDGSINITFGKTHFRISAATWKQFDDKTFCTKCKDSMTFVFPAGLDPGKASFAAAYQEPVAVRCNCSESKGAPVLIEPESDHTFQPQL